MDDILKQAKDDRKERAYLIFAICYALAGLSLANDIIKEPSLVEKREDIKVPDMFLNIFKEFLTKEGYKVKVSPKDLESKFIWLHLKAMLNPNPKILSIDELGKTLHEDFDELFWGKCIFA